MKHIGLIRHLNLEKYSVVKDKVGRSSSEVFMLKYEEETLFLKIGGIDIFNLGKVLIFLSDKNVNAPSLMKSGVFNKKYYVLMSGCKGKMMYELEPILAAKILGQTLKTLHTLDYSKDLPLRDVYYYQKKMSKMSDKKLSMFDRAFIKDMKRLSVQDDLVFSHGDYCLPNILYDRGKVSLIDLDHAGISFRYADILDCIWSLEYNYGTSAYTAYFLKAYGIDELDQKKVEEIKQIHRIMEIKGY